MGSISYRLGPFNLNVSFKDLEKFYKVWADNLKKADKIEKEEEKKDKKKKKNDDVQAAEALYQRQQVFVEKFSPAPTAEPIVVRAQVIEGELIAQEENTEYDDIEIVETNSGTRVAVVKHMTEQKEESRFVDLYAMPQEESKIS